MENDLKGTAEEKREAEGHVKAEVSTGVGICRPRDAWSHQGLDEAKQNPPLDLLVGA